MKHIKLFEAYIGDTENSYFLVFAMSNDYSETYYVGVFDSKKKEKAAKYLGSKNYYISEIVGLESMPKYLNFLPNREKKLRDSRIILGDLEIKPSDSPVLRLKPDKHGPINVEVQPNVLMQIDTEMLNDPNDLSKPLRWIFNPDEIKRIPL